MRTSKGRFAWHCALALAVTTGAAAAFAATHPGEATGKRAAPQGNPMVVTASPSNTPAPQNRVLPFNAKLTAKDVPVPGGGVRDGGCSGSLIDPLWIITAGHCFHDLAGDHVSGKPPYDVSVTIGKIDDGDPGGFIATIVDVRQSAVNDLAVAKLSAPVTGITPLTLAETKPVRGQKLDFAGWGSTSATAVVPSHRLKRGQFTVAKIDRTTVDAVPVVARTVENSPCKDDSGAPFFVSDDGVTGRLVAIENSGPDCPQPGVESLARVDVVADWIREQLEK